MNHVHDSAAAGFQSAADAYQRGRPGYSPKVSHWLAAELGVCSASKVVDLGAGTGKFTKLLAELSNDVTAVEPVEAMRRQLKQTLPSVQTIQGSATNIPLSDSSVDFVFCAQAFHWFANAQSLAEISRVLKPGGTLGLVWNTRDETVDWVAQLTRIITPYEGDAPRYYKGTWKETFPADGFGPLSETSFTHAHTGSAEDVIVNRFMSVSFIAAQDDETRSKIRQEVLETIRKSDALRDREEVTLPYITQCFFTKNTREV